MSLRPQSSAGQKYARSCETVLNRYGLEHCSLAVVGAQKLPNNSAWAVMVTVEIGPEYLDVARASRLAADLRHVGSGATQAGAWGRAITALNWPWKPTRLRLEAWAVRPR